MSDQSPRGTRHPSAGFELHRRRDLRDPDLLALRTRRWLERSPNRGMTDHPHDTVDDRARFIRYRATREPRLREALAERFLPLARHLSRRYGTRGDQEDLEQVAAVALLKAIERFDPQHGVAFSSFAVPTILGELKRYFRDHGWMVRVPRHLQDLQQRVVQAAQELTATLGRTPTVAELASACGLGIEEIIDV